MSPALTANANVPLPGTPIHDLARPNAAAIERFTALGDTRLSSDDLEYTIRQLVELAVRALSPGINDPHTAMSVIDRLGSALCEMVHLHLPGAVTPRHGTPALVTPAIDYGGLVDAMFHLIRQNAAGSAAVLIRMLEVLTAVVSCEHEPGRVRQLQRHADLLLGDGERDVSTPADLADLRARHQGFDTMRRHGPVPFLAPSTHLATLLASRRGFEPLSPP